MVYAKIAGIFAVIGAYLAFAGWAYIASFYDQFGISFRALEIPAAEYPYYAFRAIANGSGVLALIVVGIPKGVLLSKFRSFQIWVTLAAMVILFYWFYAIAASQARKDKLILCRTGQTTKLLFKAAPPSTSDLVVNAGKLKSLTQTKDSVIVFYNEGNEYSFAHVFIVLKSDLIYSENIRP